MSPDRFRQPPGLQPEDLPGGLPALPAELSAAISGHGLVSFDIFDTLLLLPFPVPDDLFAFLAPKVETLVPGAGCVFAPLRKLAEKKAQEEAGKRGLAETSLEEIHAQLALLLDLAPELSRAVLELELRATRDLLYPRPAGLAAFLAAGKSGRPVVLVSRWRLPEEFLRQTLAEKGFTGYDRLYVSSVFPPGKTDGGLFRRMCRDFSLRPDQILHLGGDSPPSLSGPGKTGVHVFPFAGALGRFMAEPGGLWERVWAGNIAGAPEDWRMVLAVLANGSFDLPWEKHLPGTLFDGKARRLGFLGLGPLLLGSGLWICRKAGLPGPDRPDRLCFLSRDGKILQEACVRLGAFFPDMPPACYLHVSRRSVRTAGLKSPLDILRLLRTEFRPGATLADLLRQRFGLDPSRLPPDLPERHGLSPESPLAEKDLPALRRLLLALADRILACAREEREALLALLREEGFRAGEKTALVDIGYSGTVQAFLADETGERTDGLYLITFHGARAGLEGRGLRACAYLAQEEDRQASFHPFCRFVPLFETLFSSREQSFVRAERTPEGLIRKVFQPPSAREARRCAVLEEIQAGALAFVDEVCRALGPGIRELDLEPGRACRCLTEYFAAPHPLDAAILAGVPFEDAYDGLPEKLILPLEEDAGLPFLWRQGRSALLGARRHLPGTELLRRALSACLIRPLARRCLKGARLRKFERLPELFFADAGSPAVRLLGKLYSAERRA